MYAQVISFHVMPQGAANILANLKPHQVRAFGEATALMSIGGDLATIAERIGSLLPAHGIGGTARQLSAPVPVIAAWAEGARLA